MKTFTARCFTHQALTDAKPSPSREVIVLSDDSFLTFKNFTRLDQDLTGPLVKFNADGSRDETFKFPDDTYSSIDVVAQTSEGQLIVSAFREDKAGRDFYRVLRLNSDGSIDATFDSGTGGNDKIRALTSLPDGKALAGGDFTAFNGVDRSYFLRLDSAGAVDTTLAPLSFATTNIYFRPSVRALALQSSGEYLLAGEFTSINQVPLNHIARLEITGVPDGTFSPSGFTVAEAGWISEWPIEALAVQPDDQILAAGSFDPGDHQTSPPPFEPMIRLNPNGDFDRYFGPNTPWPPQAYAVTLLRNGNVLFAATYLYQTDADGNALPNYPLLGFGSYDPEGYPRAYALAQQSSGDVLVAGPDEVLGAKRGGLARLHADDTLDNFYAGEFQEEVLPDKIETGPDGRIYVSGPFDRVDGVARIGFARLLADGTLDTSFDPVPQLDLYKVTGFELLQDGKLLIYGWQTDSNYEPVFLVKRVNQDGSPDSTFSAPDAAVSTQVLQEADGTYLLCFSVTDLSMTDSYADSYRNATLLQHLTSVGSEDRNFTPPSMAMATHDGSRNYTHFYIGDTRILAVLNNGGFFVKFFDKTGCYRLARAGAEGAIDPSFAMGSVAAQRVIDNFVYKQLEAKKGDNVKVLPGGQLLITGKFEAFDGFVCPGIAVINADGTPD